MLMHVNDLHAEINLPPARAGSEIHGLAQYAKAPVFVVDEYPACPANWMHGSSKASSYFLELTEGKEMWFDFEANYSHTHHVAVVISVQGVNPVTDKPITELCLIQHKDKCPEHNVDFQQDRFCPKCKHKWPAQNYIATTTGQRFWIDGFWNGDGEIKQYLITPEIAKGVAARIEKIDPKFERVWAIGFAFYLSKDPKPPQTMPAEPIVMDHLSLEACDMDSSVDYLGDVYGSELGFHDTPKGGGGTMSSLGPLPTTTQSPESYSSIAKSINEVHTKGIQPTLNAAKASLSAAPIVPASADKPTIMASTQPTAPSPIRARRVAPMRKGIGAQAARPVKQVEITKNFEIADGVRVSQSIGVDPNDVDFWQPEPAGMIYVNYASPEVLKQIQEGGKREEKVSPLEDL